MVMGGLAIKICGHQASLLAIGRGGMQIGQARGYFCPALTLLP